MFPPINIKIDRFFEPSVVGWFAPIIPGFIVLAGVGLTRPEIVETLSSISSLGENSRLAILVLSAWICGGFVRLVGFALAGIPTVGVSVFFTWKQSNGGLRPSQKTPWRRLARKLLGADLVPKYDFPLTDNVRAWLTDAISNLPKNADSERIRAEVVREATAVEQADAEWDDWHAILSKYVDWESSPKGRWFLNAAEAAGYVHASALALGFVAFLATARPTVFTLGALTLYLLGWLLEFLVLLGYAETAKDRLGFRLTADIIQNLADLSRSNRDNRDSNSEKRENEPSSKQL